MKGVSYAWEGGGRERGRHTANWSREQGDAARAQITLRCCPAAAPRLCRCLLGAPPPPPPPLPPTPPTPPTPPPPLRDLSIIVRVTSRVQGDALQMADEQAGTEKYMRGRLPALLALNAVTVIWGSQHAIVKTLVWASSASDAPITLINSLRFTLAAVTTATLSACRACRARAMGRTRATRFAEAPHTGLLRAAAELALWLVAGFTLQLVGLQWTSASRSAFLLYLNAVLVPFIACLMGDRNIGLRTWVTAFAAVSGAQ